MGTPVMQKSFNSGEWAPQLYSRVDMEKFKSGAALLQNFFVDYRGGASTRTGTQYILQAYKSSTAVRLIPFQASVSVSYVLEFGDLYIRFYNDGAPILESTDAITAVTKANPAVVTVTNSYSNGDWVLISGVVGMTQLNGNYYQVASATGSTIALQDLNGNNINSTAFTTYVSGGTTARVYTLASPYAAADLGGLTIYPNNDTPGIKYAQEINAMVLCHPNYPTKILTLVTFNNWTLTAPPFGAGLSGPTIFASQAGLSAGNVVLGYQATSINSQGEESSGGPVIATAPLTDLRTNPGTILLTVAAPVAGAVGYSFYKSEPSYFGGIPAGSTYGFIGSVAGVQLLDSNISPNFAQTPPIGQNPFIGSSVASVTQVTAGTYTTVPSAFTTGGSPTSQAVLQAILGVHGTPTVGSGGGGSGYAVNDTISLGNGVVVVVATQSGGAVLTYFDITHAGASAGSLAIGATPTNPVAQVSTSGSGTGATVVLAWGVTQTIVNNGGNGYLGTPTVVYNPAGATATAVLTAASTAYPGVPGFFQQRLCLAAAVSGPETLNFSQPGSYYNYNINDPIEPDDAISVTLASGQLETVKSLVPTAPGLVVFTDKSSWLVTGGSLGSAITPSAIVANRQSFNGANDVPPILNNYDILYVEEKGSAVRDANYNYYAQVFTGQDISVVSSHLFYGYQVVQWAWGQAPFKTVWSLRSDGVMLVLTYAKEEDFIAWTHQTTPGSSGTDLFTSVATVPEQIADGMVVDAIYCVTKRTINGVTSQFIERFADRVFNVSNGPNLAKYAWCVDSGLQYNGSPATTFAGAQHLGGATVTGLADGVVIPPFTMPLSGTFTLPTAASVVTIGLGFTAQLQTLPLDTGEPTIQGKMKKISAVVVRCVDTLGLQIGQSFNTLVAMQDLIVGNVGSMTNQVVTDLVTGDTRTIIDPVWATTGQFCIQQNQPLPATITGVIPQLTVGDTVR